ncbi:MAG TPA: hypothetical protein VEM41_04750 [Actinomycetota bacterium]|nr:hypothetical protein [Actinomycetota bacterium]
MRTGLLAALGAVCVAAAACTHGSSGSTAPPSPIPVASAASQPDGTKVTVSGGVVAPVSSPVHICEAATFSIPPRCVLPALTVEGLDPSSLPGASTDGGVTWTSHVTVTGTMQGGKLTGAEVVPAATPASA